jgi:hypothetical protein
MTHEDFKRAHLELTRPFDVDKLHWRVGATNKDANNPKGIALAFIDARDVMQRLDGVVGMADWRNFYPYAGTCELSIRIDDEWITKTNAAGETQVEAEKGMASDAFKRAAVLWGIARYLYYLPTVWVELSGSGKWAKIKQPPQLPNWALPENWDTFYYDVFKQDPPQNKNTNGGK